MNLRVFHRNNIIVAKRFNSANGIRPKSSATPLKVDASNLTFTALANRFTGTPAYPVIAGVRVDNATQELVDSGEIGFYELEEIR